MIRSALLIADCGPGHGLGHLRRSLVLADALRRRGVACRFRPAHASGEAPVREAGFAVGDDPGAELVVVDSYVIAAADVAALGHRHPVVLVIDDNADRPLPATVVLNHNIYGGQLDYAAYGARLVLTGPRHSLVDPAFANLAGMPRTAPRAVVSFGATDDGGLGLPVAQSVGRATGLPVDLMIAPGHALPAAPKGVTCRQGADMAQLMAGASLFVGAAGVTALEAAAAGLSLVLCSIAANQDRNVRAFARHGVRVGDAADAEGLGCLAVGAEPVALGLDGRGGDRVVEELFALAEVV